MKQPQLPTDQYTTTLATGPLKEGFIIGKHESVQQFSDTNWKQFESYGINQAAHWYNTKYAFTAHQEAFQYLCTCVNFKNLVIGYPMYEGAKINDNEFGFFRHVLRQNPGEDVYKHVPLTNGELKHHLLKALNKDETFYFPNYWTSLHLCIFHMIWFGYTRIHLIGCNMEGDFWPDQPQSREYAIDHTTRLMAEAQTIGIEILWHKSRNLFDEWAFDNQTIKNDINEDEQFF